MNITMNRRRFLRHAAFLVTALSGCVENRREETLPDSIDVEQLHIVGDAYTAARVDPADGDAPRYQLVGDEPTATDVLQTTEWSSSDDDRPENVTARDDEIAGVESFIDRTEFDDEILVVVVDGYYSSQEWLEVSGIERDTDSLDITVTIERDGEVVDDAHVHTLLLRIGDGEDSEPDAITVEVENDRAEEFEASLPDTEHGTVLVFE